MKTVISTSVEKSLVRLKTDYIDILQIHHQVGDIRGKYQFRSNPPEFAPRLDFQDCIDYMGISKEYFWEKIDEFRSPHLWTYKDGNWILHQELEELKKVTLKCYLILK